jgi:hypothetical protein
MSNELVQVLWGPQFCRTRGAPRGAALHTCMLISKHLYKIHNTSQFAQELIKYHRLADAQDVLEARWSSIWCWIGEFNQR